ncbi:hypothetical protein GLOTRDRAFT_39106 [Gloeophyllum trabeum ATCC 11539]|uniref:Sister chromatid cohesion protein Dcc1 n=1 Tax=Gloeophyllum trabeum (strain ATCC 11539 / FP-39264 / Madison 617) TaxID=670483 RepID=S7QDY2_GLOTA|nr:uncharacterized protein GLOTRDRAFT_39106 [Gloeophyllum trabeum ATCC 11539]EPQ57498.1 hypothetical protein GLOTRDRAFT_39106 [Gloeophyllum trabeum ATCC 11539]
MDETEVVFPWTTADAGTFKLLELPPDLLKLVEAYIEGNASLNLSVKGGAEEDAVLCTDEKTYTMRSVVLSNSVLVLTPAPEAGEGMGDKVVIQDELHDIIELVPSLPKLHKLKGILRGLEYDEGYEDEEMMDEDEEFDNTQTGTFSYADAMHLQASEGELRRGLRDMRILDIGGRLRPIAPSYLNTILELILNHLVSHSLHHDAVPVDELSAAMKDEHEVDRQVTTQVLLWFGTVKDGKWEMNAEEVIKQIGLGILRPHKDAPIAEQEFLEKWKSAVGDTFESYISLKLLEVCTSARTSHSGNYLSSMSRDTFPAVLALTYFPSSSLPTDPAARFTDLFLTRPKWKAEDIAPYLADVAVDSKERDKLLLKYARATKDAEGMWYTARNKI